jgi:hypothetical protein
LYEAWRGRYGTDREVRLDPLGLHYFDGSPPVPTQHPRLVFIGDSWAAAWPASALEVIFATIMPYRAVPLKRVGYWMTESEWALSKVDVFLKILSAPNLSGFLGALCKSILNLLIFVQ